jgi:Uma2 family endonuclease
MATQTEATLEDLRRADGKAELVHGEILKMSPAGGRHWYVSSLIAASLNVFARQHGIQGVGGGDNGGFVVNLPHRRTFSPDAAFYCGPLTNDFLEGAPVFAVEIRSKEDYGPAAERRLAQKRADYFAARTKVVWDVDLDGEVVVRSYSVTAPEAPAEFRCGDVATAELALPGWGMPVDEFLLSDR